MSDTSTTFQPGACERVCNAKTVKELEKIEEEFASFDDPSATTIRRFRRLAHSRRHLLTKGSKKKKA